MRKSIIGLFFCLISSALWAAESDSSVVFKASFLKNELQSYEISRVLYTLQKGDTTSFERIRIKADMYVKDSTESYYLVTWKFSNFSINTTSSQLKQLIASTKPVEICCRISKPGVFIEFLDGEHVSTCLDEVMPKILEQYAGKKGKVVEAEVASIYDMRETIETLMLRSVSQFYQVYGLGYNLGEIVDVPTEVISRFSPTPILGMTRKKLTKIDPINHLAILSSATLLDNKGLQKAITEYLHVDSLPENAIHQEIMGGVVMDLSTGWLLWTFDQREIRTGNTIYGERVEIEHLNGSL